jgi:formate hydrogenlyase subunit 3/multisubunit Na+/H+ antiporter MnhD subunit
MIAVCLISIVVVAGSAFYTSGTFWAGAGAVIGVISIVVIAYVTLRAADLKRRLWYSMPESTPLVANRKGLCS